MRTGNVLKHSAWTVNAALSERGHDFGSRNSRLRTSSRPEMNCFRIVGERDRTSSWAGLGQVVSYADAARALAGPRDANECGQWDPGTSGGAPKNPSGDHRPRSQRVRPSRPEWFDASHSQDAYPVPTGARKAPLSPAIECASLLLSRSPSQRRQRAKRRSRGRCAAIG